MRNKRQKAVVIATASVLSISASLSTGTGLYAQETDKESRETAAQQIKLEAPLLTLPQSIEGIEGQALQEIALPSGWSWKDGATLLSRDVSSYYAIYITDDETYDYTKVEGYNADNHIVETKINITVQENEPLIDETTIEQNTTMVADTGDVAIGATNFPDDAFRSYIKGEFDTNGDDVLDTLELSMVNQIDIAGQREIKSLKGIEHFIALEQLFCSNTGITELDVRNNPALVFLFCSYTEINTLDISNNLALELLGCSATGITELNIKKNIALNNLSCGNTGITQLDLSENLALESLDCSSGKITELNISNNIALKELSCGGAGITTLDVSNNLALEALNCRYTGITELNIKNNIALKSLNCNGTGITQLDLSKNIALESLDCSSGKITQLDVSKNIALEYLDCGGGEITQLDVSKNLVLNDLQIDRTKMGYLNIGNNPALSISKDDLKPFNFDVMGASFNIRDIFEGIDVNKISNMSGATLDKETGIVSGFSAGEAITYTYDCGISKNGVETIDVTILPQKEIPEVAITKNLDKVYDGTPVTLMDKDIETVSNGVKTYTWEQWMDEGSWIPLAEAPVNAGNYQVTVSIAETDKYSKAKTTMDVSIYKASPSPTPIIKLNKDLNKIYDGQAVTVENKDIEIIESTGEYSIEWYDEKGIGSHEAPVNAGTYDLLINIEGDANHHGTNKVVTFTIDKAETTIELNKDLNKTYDDTFVILTDNDLRITGSTGAISYQWEMEQDGQWVSSGVPKNAGNYRVQIRVAEDENHKAGTATFSFTINSVVEEGGTPGTEPGADAGNQTSTNTGELATNVKTGDNQMTEMFGGLSILSLGVLGWLIIRKRKQNIKES